ncbi:hypothetical protein IU440_28750 [Nocardia cyriacigeorgica]|uniref:hypothetical protein n=1 Tax=Nocardia cyriacigeorgica TaxID=135487 RepID=UPI001894218D|nr:hypothetical protein [Nocardia cyriacigeorgica]MBF6428669.1 hypothetical protein [Nocardia cyriacigeorgica]
MNLSKWTKPLHYKGDRREAIPAKVGPNLMGEYYYPVGHEYDPDTDQTTIHYALVL